MKQIFKATDDAKCVEYRTINGDESITCDRVMLATGRRPVIPAGADALNITVERTGIVVGPSLQTNLKHIYAVGDVNGRTPLFHAAVRQSLVAAHNIMAGNVPTDYADFLNVPTTIFTVPECAYVGIMPTQAEKNGINLIEKQYKFSHDSRAQIYGEVGGSIHLFFECGSTKLVGAYVVGIDAGYLIGQLGIACSKSLTARDLAEFPDQHPMSSEGISAAARSLL